jgi:hypothetical protein
MTRANLDWWPALCHDYDQIVSNVEKKRCSGNVSVFKGKIKI